MLRLLGRASLPDYSRARLAAAAAALGASRPHLWRGLARPSCGCSQKALFPEPCLPSHPTTGPR